jgi:hypothetical protein
MSDKILPKRCQVEGCQWHDSRPRDLRRMFSDDPEVIWVCSKGGVCVGRSATTSCVKCGFFLVSELAQAVADEEMYQKAVQKAYPSLEEKCAIKDCTNKRHQGSFNGPVCSPCYENHYLTHKKREGDLELALKAKEKERQYHMNALNKMARAIGMMGTTSAAIADAVCKRLHDRKEDQLPVALSHDGLYLYSLGELVKAKNETKRADAEAWRQKARADRAVNMAQSSLKDIVALRTELLEIRPQLAKYEATMDGGNHEHCECVPHLKRVAEDLKSAWSTHPPFGLGWLKRWWELHHDGVTSGDSI